MWIPDCRALHVRRPRRRGDAVREQRGCELPRRRCRIPERRLADSRRRHRGRDRDQRGDRSGQRHSVPMGLGRRRGTGPLPDLTFEGRPGQGRYGGFARSPRRAARRRARRVPGREDGRGLHPVRRASAASRAGPHLGNPAQRSGRPIPLQTHRVQGRVRSRSPPHSPRFRFSGPPASGGSNAPSSRIIVRSSPTSPRAWRPRATSEPSGSRVCPISSTATMLSNSPTSPAAAKASRPKASLRATAGDFPRAALHSGR